MHRTGGRTLPMETALISASDEREQASRPGDMPRRKRVLLGSYAFPPVGGAGVQRAAKFTKYLGRFGWSPTVLTVSNPSVPVLDRSLERELPAETQIIRAPSWEPGYRLKAQAAGGDREQTKKRSLKRWLIQLAGRLASTVLQPDPQVLWYPGAVREGKRRLQAERFDAVLATAPPFSAFLVGAALARFARIPLVVDYRDEWTISNRYWENKKLGAVSAAVQARMEANVLRAASTVIATTRASAESLREQCQRAGSNAHVTWIYNGFDAEDFSGRVAPAQDRSRFRLVYTGTLWNLTSVESLVRAVRKLSEAHPELCRKLEIVIAGRRTDVQSKYVESLREHACQVETHDYLSHGEALDLLCNADAGCLLLSDVPGAARVVPAKLFEYMASARPILAIIPRGETWDLLNQHPQAHRFLPADSDAIANWLASALADQPAGPAKMNPIECAPERFSREFQTGQLAELLNQCCSADVAGK